MRYYFLISLFCLVGCAATRKISKVEIREPASVEETKTYSETRIKISTDVNFPKQCSKEIQEGFPSLATELVPFPPCPSLVIENLDPSTRFLTLEERSTLEEVLSTQCRTLNRTKFSDSIETMYANFNTSGPLGRTQDPPATEEEGKRLQDLKKGIEEIMVLHLALSRWVERSGSFVLAEDDLVFLNKIFKTQSCKVQDQDLDRIYRTVRSLEDLSQIITDANMKTKLADFIEQIHRLIDEKVKEYFYP